MKLSHAMQSGRFARVMAGLICLIGMAVVLALPAQADQVTFNDLTDTVSATITPSSSGSSVTIDQCGLFSVMIHGTAVSVEGCKATITGPRNSDSFRAPLLTLIGGDNGRISDAIIVMPDVFSDNKLHVIFASDPEIPGTPGFGVACSTLGGCQVTETGGVQPGVTIAWSNGQTDIVSFQSDTDSIVPEPSSLILLGGGLLAVAGYLKRRLT